MFDHGCDSLSQVFISLEVALAMRLGYHPDIMLLGTLYSLLLFYSAHWQTYCSGHLQFHKFDVTEAQFLVIFICLVSGIFGPRFWAISIFNIIELRVLAMLVSTLMGLRQLYQYLEVVFTGGVGKNGSTVADTSVIFPVIPIAQALIPALMIYYKSTETGSIFVEHIVLYLITIGLVTSKITNRLIVAHMCKSELIAWDSILYGPLMIFLNQYFNNILPEYAVLVVCCAYCSLNLLCYCVVVCNQICDYLRIRCFVIAPPPPTPTPATREPLKTAYERR